MFLQITILFNAIIKGYSTNNLAIKLCLSCILLLKYSIKIWKEYEKERK